VNFSVNIDVIGSILEKQILFLSIDFFYQDHHPVYPISFWDVSIIEQSIYDFFFFFKNLP
jgi:hypothetical protein